MPKPQRITSPLDQRPIWHLAAKLATAAAFLAAALFFQASISIYTFPIPAPPDQADAAIVLGAAVWEDEPSPVYQSRISHAIYLYESGVVDYIIFTGALSQGDLLSEAEAGKAYAVDAGVPPDRILMDTQSSVTCENLRNAKDLATEKGFHTFLIVSDPLHMKRSLAMARDLGMIAYPSPTPTTRYTSWRSILPFLTRETYFLLTYRVQTVLTGYSACLPQ